MSQCNICFVEKFWHCYCECPPMKIKILYLFIVSLLSINTGLASTDAERKLENQRLRARIISLGHSVSAPRENDNVANLLDELRYATVFEIDGAGLTEASLPINPWSDSYWPLYMGALAFRYSDIYFPRSDSWQENNAYIMNNLGRAEFISALSPAEKYDLLIGKENFPLTLSMLDNGRKQRNSRGSVPAWMGICHGWAPASYMVARPTNTVNLLAADGITVIPFFPSDIKALVTALWASVPVPTRFIGGRCNEVTPGSDTSGRPINPDCLDSNPASWHLAVVNQIGHAKRSFVMDYVSTSEVWNQPVTKYKFTYFNPQTMYYADINGAIVPTNSFPEDKYKKFRDTRAVSIIGIQMTVTYVGETQPSDRGADDESFDQNTEAEFLYDLELDAEGKIIGGEWYREKHPDFLWQPVPGSKPKSLGDMDLDAAYDLSNWDKNSVIPAAWRTPAARSAAASQPLARIVDKLVQFSNEY